MKKALSCFLLFFFLAFMVLAVSCGSQEEESFDVDFQSTFEPDLSGMTFTWGSAWASQMFPTEGFSNDGDKMRARYREVEKTLDCKINIVQWENAGNRIMQEAAAGILSLDILDNETHTGPVNLYKANMLVALDDISTIDPYNENFGPIRFRQYGIFDGKIYGVYQYEWDFPPEYAGALMYNTEMLSSFGLPVPHELEENGEWTWENYRRYLRDIADGARNSGVEGSFVPHICSNYAFDAFSFMFMNGCQGIENQKGYEALDYMRSLYDEGLYKQDDTAVMIKNQMAAILTTESYYGTHFHDGYNQNYLPYQGYAYGFTTFPYGPNGNDSCVSGFVHIGRRLHYILRYSPNDKDDIGILFNELFKPIDETGGWRGSLERQVFYDSRDYDKYRYMLENVNYNYSFDLGSAYSDLTSALSSAAIGRKTPAEALQSVRDAVNAEISEHVIVFSEDLNG